MPRIRICRDLSHEQVDFPEEIKPHESRGDAPGSLHLRRNSLRDVTDEELEYIRTNLPALFRTLEVLPEPEVSKALQRKLKQAEDKAKMAKPVKGKKSSK